MGGGGQNKFIGYFLKMPVKIFLSEFRSWFLALRVELAGAGTCWVRKYSESLFHVLKLHNLPPLFYNYIFYCASK